MGRLFLACAASLGAYLVLFGLVLEKPLSLGVVPEMVQYKRAYAARLPSPKLLIVGASNARYSHRCETLAAALGMPCANLGMAAGLSLEYMRAEFAPVVRPGDVIYAPLEYGFYRDSTLPRIERAIWVAWSPQRLRGLPASELVAALFQFDLKFALAAAAEMALHRAGLRARSGAGTLTEQGDEKGHTEAKAAAYRQFVAVNRGDLPRMADIAAARTGPRELRAFLDWAAGRGARVVGGLPTTFDDLDPPPELVAHARRQFTEAGHAFVVLPNLSLYPRSCFYDTHYHLNEECQKRHSALLAAALRPLVTPGGN
jgi:hypothetical protein